MYDTFKQWKRTKKINRTLKIQTRLWKFSSNKRHKKHSESQDCNLSKALSEYIVVLNWMHDIITLQRPLVLHLVVFSDIISHFCVPFINLAINRKGLIKQLESSFGPFSCFVSCKSSYMYDGGRAKSSVRESW